MSLLIHSYLLHILQDADFLIARRQGLTRETLSGDEVMKRAVVRSLEVIGEAAKNLPAEFPAP